jgi:diguanylate cyclase (GGDEF)-like protein
VSSEAHLNGIKKAAKAFNQGVVEALHNIVGIEFAVDFSHSFSHSHSFASNHRLIVCLPFTGVLYGEFFLCFSPEPYLVALEKISGKKEKSAENRALLLSTMQEVVNIAAGSAMIPLKETFGSLTMQSPRVLEGTLHYPHMQIFSSTLQGKEKGESLDAKISLDLMEQDINIQQQKLQEKSILDDTGLYNKKHFFEVLEQMEERAKKEKFAYSIIFTDINRLKYVNDNLGHDAGDAFIKKSCALLTEAQDKDAMSFRIGGDELVMVLPACNLAAGEKTLKKLKMLMTHAEISAVNLSSGHKEVVPLHLSVGLASSSEGFDSAEKVLKHADLRMEEDKRQWYVKNKLDRRK